MFTKSFNEKNDLEGIYNDKKDAKKTKTNVLYFIRLSVQIFLLE